jgi:site-specific recombinase XerD
MMMLTVPEPNALATMTGSWQQVAAQYMNELYQRSRSARTPTEYGRYVARFLEGIDDPAAATAAQVHAFCYNPGPSGKPPSQSTIMVRLAALHGFYDLARRVRLIETNPAADVKRPGASDPTPRGLSADDIRALLEATPQTPAGARDRAAIITAVLTGLRRAEILSLTRGSLEHRAGRVYYSTRTKGGHQRHRELPAPAYRAIQTALRELGTPLETLAPDAPLFPIGGEGFRVNLKRYAKRAGLEGVSPHVLRHSAAKLRRESGSSIEDIGTFLGHRSLHTTSRYLARLEGEHDTGWYGVAAALGVAMGEGEA